MRFESLVPFALAFALMLGSPTGSSAAPPAVVPQPVELQESPGEFTLTADTTVVAQGEAVATARQLVAYLSAPTTFTLTLATDAPQENAIHLELSDSLPEQLGEEGYTLEVTPRRVTIAARNPAGLFYGVQTLRQLLPSSIYRSAAVEGTEWTIPCVKVTDYPRFAWRGLLIDPARHFIPKADVLRYIDAMALHKFNRLQIHLTDSEGWWIEIKRYPLLTEIGSKWHIRMNPELKEGRVYGGFYTQDDIREIVQYAADRHVVVVPEIEMPFHAGAAIASYPELGMNAQELEQVDPSQRWKQAGHQVVPRRSTIEFFQNVLDEVIELFPSEYIHIGGDEANSQLWADLPEMQQLMEREGLKDVHQLHSWFIRQMDSHIAKRGRRMVGWDEILQGGLAEGATVMSWRGTARGIAAAKAGHDVIMAPVSHTYFDFLQSLEHDKEFLGLHHHWVVSLETVYTFNPIPSELTPEQAQHVLGGQGQLWGEFIPNEQHRQYMTYPRACALIERLWSPKDHREYPDFLKRLKRHLQRLKAAGIHFRRLDLPEGGNPA